ncbi:MaoC family dehydratase [Noviherbaspirillum pedocola]|uniref:MaoC family dehydratase n=1 Tax=Noviherbaspirillum pedocola TaxID=2801341 RepID=A0A934SWK4_9BURK|nr:MaoC family dehydratase [Noviherbaspirillum pedocola]MBK4736743.1 MaoC family dehydratase [Noviherbaspirillum pedocola]
MKFADIVAGRRFQLGPVRVEEEEVIDFARRYDDQWFHTDPEAAERGPFQGLIASGWHTCALAMRLVSREILQGSESFASPGLSHVRWPHPVRPGDELTLEVVVHESRTSASRPTLGVVRWQWLMRNGHGTLVLDLEATSMFRLAAA